MLNELYDEETGIEPGDEDTFEITDELVLRSTMIRTFQLGREQDKVKATLDSVAHAYRAQLERLDREQERLRSSIAAYVERNGKQRFPDVGTAYLAEGKPKIEIVDRDALKAEVGDLFTKEQFDETGAKHYALEQATEHGVIVAGTELVPGGPRLQIRKA